LAFLDNPKLTLSLSHTYIMSASNKKPVKKLDPASADYKECLGCLEEMEEKPEAEPFMIPVDWKGLNLPDYPKIVKKPMDLGTIRVSLRDQE
jgi:hypothetical protein